MKLTNPILLLAIALLACVSCKTTETSTDEFDYDFKLPETNEQKMQRMFGAYDPNKTSEFDGKAFLGKDAKMRKAFDRKEAPEHPYYKLHKKAPFSDKSFSKKESLLGKKQSRMDEKESSWVKKIFKRKGAREDSQDIARKEYKLPNSSSGDFDKRSFYERKKYPVTINEWQNKRKKSFTLEDLKGVDSVKALLNKN